MENVLLSVSEFNNVKPQFDGKFFVVRDDEHKTMVAFHVNKVEVCKIEDSKEDTSAIYAIGNELIVEGNIAVNMICRYPILNDLHFGIWDSDMSIPQNELNNSIINHFADNGNVDNFSNDCDITDFFENRYKSDVDIF